MAEPVPSSLADRVLARDPRAVARAISHVENESPEAAPLVSRIAPHTGRAYLIGLTGPPGAGKSTLADRLIAEFRQRGTTVGVLAVDPTSPYSGGAMLGDRVRMQAHAEDAGVFIRSMATRGHPGGLARRTADAALVLDAAGCGVVIIETVGVGQAEVDIMRTADVSIVTVMPGGGDDVQAFKAGLMEIGDIFVVNKADREGADRTAASITAMLSGEVRESGAWTPPVLLTEATTGRGVRELVEAVEAFRSHTASSLVEQRRQRAAWQAGRPRVPRDRILDHVGIAVQDATEMIDFFARMLGLETGPAAHTALYTLRFVDTGETTIELVEPTSADSPVAKFLAAHGSGLHHICVRVPDIDAALASLSAKGVKLIDQVARPGAHGSRIAFIHPSSACGLLIELKQVSTDN